MLHLSRPLAGNQDLFHLPKVFFCVYADGVVVGRFDVEVEAVFKESELFEVLAGLKDAVGKRGKAVECSLAVCVKADVFPVGGLSGCVAVVGDGGAGEVERATIGGGDDLDGVWICNIRRSAGNFEGRDVDVRACKRAEKSSEVFGTDEGFVTLDVDVDVSWVDLGDGMDAVRAAGQVG